MTRNLKSLTLVAGLAATLIAAPAVAAVSTVNANYKANYMGMSATGRISVSAMGGNKYKSTLSVSNALGFTSQVTVFDEAHGTLRPLSSTDSNKFMGKKSDVKANYDWNGGVARWDGDDLSAEKKGPARMQAGDMDALLLNLAIVRDFAEGRPLTYRMLENGKASTLRFTPAGKETVTIGGKTVTATKLVGSGTKSLTVWAAPGYSVPVKIVKAIDMGKLTLTLSSVN